MRRSPRPTTCSQSSWLPKARTPRMWVTLWASQPSLSMATETTQRTCSPGSPFTPTVATICRSCSAASLRVTLGSPDSAWASSLLSMRMVGVKPSRLEKYSGKTRPWP